MQIRQWHIGQLVVFWVAILLVTAVLFLTFDSIPQTTTFYPPLAGRVERHPIGDILAWVWRLLILGAIAGGLAVTWIWFSGRRSAQQGAQMEK